MGDHTRNPRSSQYKPSVLRRSQDPSQHGSFQADVPSLVRGRTSREETSRVGSALRSPTAVFMGRGLDRNPESSRRLPSRLDLINAQRSRENTGRQGHSTNRASSSTSRPDVGLALDLLSRSNPRSTPQPHLMLLPKISSRSAALPSILKTKHDRTMASRQTRIETLAPEERKKQDEWAQESISRLGVCPRGFTWRRESNGYRCRGGMHSVSDELLAEGKGGFFESFWGGKGPTWGGPFYSIQELEDARLPRIGDGKHFNGWK
ncbi:hypothetical protein EG329_010293 [Mollisiaceae sp. DMI_Dod_QoI]|nr:hypothetical protein EG329_010293 [Helotiales sp. DMI_Dod_QoI]